MHDAGTSGGPSNEGLSNFAFGNETLFFETPDNTPTSGDIGVELWRSDGTPGGTVMVADINPSWGKFFFPGGPAAKQDLSTGNSTIVFQFSGLNGSMWLQDNVQSTSMVTESSGKAVIFALTTDQALWRYDSSTGWQSLATAGNVRYMTAGIDVNGLADVFVVLTDGSLSEWREGLGWPARPLI